MIHTLLCCYLPNLRPGCCWNPEMLVFTGPFHVECRITGGASGLISAAPETLGFDPDMRPRVSLAGGEGEGGEDGGPCFRQNPGRLEERMQWKFGHLTSKPSWKSALRAGYAWACVTQLVPLEWGSLSFHLSSSSWPSLNQQSSLHPSLLILLSQKLLIWPFPGRLKPGTRGSVPNSTLPPSMKPAPVVHGDQCRAQGQATAR